VMNDRDHDPTHSEVMMVTMTLGAQVGKMELFSQEFAALVERCLSEPRLVVLGSVPVPRYGREIPYVAEVK
jgi:nucleoside-triphosphatase THEP1